MGSPSGKIHRAEHSRDWGSDRKKNERRKKKHNPTGRLSQSLKVEAISPHGALHQKQQQQQRHVIAAVTPGARCIKLRKLKRRFTTETEVHTKPQKDYFHQNKKKTLQSVPINQSIFMRNCMRMVFACIHITHLGLSVSTLVKHRCHS